MAKSTKLEPVTLPSWPSCENCIAWSDDDIAVAGTEVIHVLTPKRASTNRDTSGHAQWHLNTIRANIFDEDEWPFQTLAALSHYSTGEEQSNSSVVALSWSYSGLGMHKRPVLAVLTANLVLSLWETDGSLGQYRRTCVINHFLMPGLEDPGIGSDRRKLRVRAFNWLPPIQIDDLQSVHHVVVADDRPSIVILHVVKASSAHYGGWSVIKVSHCALSASLPKTRSVSTLQKRLQEQAPISRLEVGAWHQTGTSTDDLKRHTLPLKVIDTWGLTRNNLVVTTTVATTSQAEDVEDDNPHTAMLEITNGAGSQVLDSTKATTNDGISNTTSRDDVILEQFKQALQPLYTKFDREHQLEAHYRVRLWGTAHSHDETTAAVCVTLHGSDMIEHVIPSAEKTYIVFRKLSNPEEPIAHDRSAAEDPRDRIAAFVTSKSGDPLIITSGLDEKIRKIHGLIARGQATALGQSDIPEVGSERTYDHNASAPNGTGTSPGMLGNVAEPSNVVVSSNVEASPTSASPEICEICNAEIPFLGSTTPATCRTGHQFTRCNLSFVAIQEPGISKYCSGCGMQYLDLAKLEPIPGPGLSRALFDAFDVCPYCQAKFRG